MNELIFWFWFFIVLFVLIGIIAAVQRKIQKSENSIKEYFCILYDNNFYHIPPGSSEEDCVNILGNPNEVGREKNLTTMKYFEKVGSSGRKHTIKIYFKENQIINFATY